MTLPPAEGSGPSPPGLSPPLAPPVAAAPVPPAKPRYFYFGRDYGSEALYGPLWVFVNRGFDESASQPGTKRSSDSTCQVSVTKKANAR